MDAHHVHGQSNCPIGVDPLTHPEYTENFTACQQLLATDPVSGFEHL